ncbi:MAG: LamG domain-containing protein, partial [Chloroflexi bacterium]
MLDEAFVVMPGVVWFVALQATSSALIKAQNSPRTSKAAIDEVHLYNRALTDQEIASVCTVPSANTAPTVNALSNATINEGSAYTASGSFSDPNAGDAWTASVDYGDGSGKQTLALNADKTFNL